MNRDSAATGADLADIPGAGDDPQQILAQRVERLYSQAPLAAAGTLGFAVIAAYGLWGVRFREFAPFWWGVVLLTTAASAVVYASYRRSVARAASARQWMRWLAISALASGATWGFASAVFLPSHGDSQPVFLALLLAGVGCVGMWCYAASWPIFALHAAAIAAPLLYALAASGDRASIELALLVVALFGVSVGIVYRMQRVFRAADGLRRTYRNLSERYASLGERHASLGGRYKSLGEQLNGQMEELTQAQRMIQHSGRKLALFAERAPIPVFEVDRKATILDVNVAAETVFGYSSSELIGRNLLRSIIPPEAPVLNGGWWTNFVAAKLPDSGLRAHCPRRDGIEVVCEFVFTPLVNETGDLISVIVQARDITQQLDAERVKKEFTSTLSHELRTPLTSVIGSLQLVNSGALGELGQDIGELTEVAERNAQRLLDLINDILDIEKIESGRFSIVPEDIELDHLVRESLVLNRAFADRFGVRLLLPNELPRIKVYADRRRLLQVLTNLISNAAKFSPQGEQIELGVSIIDSRAVVSVDDRGPGIPAEFRSRIFSRFTQADSALTRTKGGTGLGLAISKHLVELMDGQIGFADREGGGTRFYIELPLREYAKAGLH